jgi:hypothetical protein
MTTVIAVCGVAVAVAAGARSTWSPCGLSMLASITPLAEQGRGHRYRSTAAWFVLGAVAGGACLGAALAALAAGVGATGASATTLAVLACAAALVAAAADARVGGFRLPVHRRQVNERWLDQFRPWVYGAGFGWQIGTGLVTYVKASAVYLMIVLAALTADPALALAVGVVFGLVRGLAVLLGRRITSPAALAGFHRRFAELEPVVLGVVVAVEVAVALLVASLVSLWAALAVVGTILVVVAATGVPARRSRRALHLRAGGAPLGSPR